MMKFKVKAGCHIDGEGKVYTKGEIVESFQDLSVSFPGKFERVSSPVLTTTPTSEGHRSKERLPSQSGLKESTPPFSPPVELEKSSVPPSATVSSKKPRRTLLTEDE